MAKKQTHIFPHLSKKFGACFLKCFELQLLLKQQTDFEDLSVVALRFLKSLYSRKDCKPENSRIFDVVFVVLSCNCCVDVVFVAL